MTFHHLHRDARDARAELARFAAERADADDIRQLRLAVAAQGRSGAFREWSRLDEEFHLAVAEMSGNPACIIARAPISQLLVLVLHRFIRSTTHTEHATATTAASSARSRRAIGHRRGDDAPASATSVPPGRRRASTSIWKSPSWPKTAPAWSADAGL